MLGGTLAQLFSYRVTFFITGALLLSVFILSYYFVEETFEPVTKENMLSGKEVIGAIRHPKLIIGMFVTTLIIQASNTSISPILALYVREIMPRGAAVTFFCRHCRGHSRRCHPFCRPTAWSIRRSDWNGASVVDWFYFCHPCLYSDGLCNECLAAHVSAVFNWYF